MQLNNVLPAPDLRALSRLFGRDFIEQTSAADDLEKLLAQGWTVAARLKRGIRFRRPKDLAAAFPDRVWTLMYKMGFTHLSAKGGARLICRGGEGQVPTCQAETVPVTSKI